MSDTHYRREFDDAMHQVDLHKAKHRERMAVMQEQLPAIAASATSANGAVTVTVNAEGILTGLRLSEAVGGMRPVDVADAVLRAYGGAQRDAARQVAELVTPHVGDEGYVQDRLRWRQGFEPSVTHEVLAEKPPAFEDEDDDFDPRSAYRA